jgi:hypothetical protein
LLTHGILFVKIVRSIVTLLFILAQDFKIISMKNFFSICLLIITCGLNAQTLTGTLKDATTGETLPFVNLGLLNKNIGTVSDDNGVFNLAVPKVTDNDTVRISTIGYGTKNIPLAAFQKQLKDNPIVLMEEEATQLEELVITNEKPEEEAVLKDYVMGNLTKSQRTSVGFTSNKLGNEIGMMMKISVIPTQLKTFSASLTSVNNPKLKMRLNFYSLKDGMPDKLIIKENIIVVPPPGSTIMEVDLTPYNIVVDGNFFVSLEWIESSKKAVTFSADFSETAIPMMIRATSQGDWEKANEFGVGFTVTGSYW